MIMRMKGARRFSVLRSSGVSVINMMKK